MPRRNPSLSRALDRVHAIAAQQAGAATTAQAREAGLPPDAIRRLLSTGRWTSPHRGVYLTEQANGGLASRMWAAHLALGLRSVVGGTAAARYWGLTDEELSPGEEITMVLPDGCRRSARGVRVTRVPDPAALAHPARTPPLLSVESTVLAAVASASSDTLAVDVILRSCRLRLTTPDRLLAAAAQRRRLRRRELVKSVCAEVRAGVTSPLERLYRNRVARAHGLPSGRAQAPSSSQGARRAYRDVLYEPEGVIVELDGRLGHELESDALRDLTRDNHATLTGHATLRFGWVAVAGHACGTAAQVRDLLVLRGWSGSAIQCDAACLLEGARGRWAAV
jgi:hypothetical protein